MNLPRGFFLLGVLACWLPGEALAEDAGGVSGAFTRFLSPELRRMEVRIAEIQKKMEPLPKLKEHPWGSRYGHRSADLPDETTPDWLQLDLGRRCEVDMLALMPVNLSYQGKAGWGHGFPKRFRVEISEHADMRDAVVVVDHSKADVPNPARYPLVFEFAPVAGRYVRFTSLKHDFRDGVFFWALEELFVLEGNMQVGAGASVRNSSSTDLFPQWAPVRVIDGQSALGMPVDVTSPSSTIGYLSARLPMKLDSKGDPLPTPAKKWCMIDLEEPIEINQVRLLPLESGAYEVFGGRGFPPEFTMQLANDSDFHDVIWETYAGRYPLGYPDGCAVNVTVPNVRARYVRVVAETMWSRDDFFVFGLSEIQVYGADRNLALGKPVNATDLTERDANEGWAPAHLVDGFTSRYRLIEWREYLRLIEQRAKLELEKNHLHEKRVAKYSLGKTVMGGSLAVCSVAAISAWVFGMVRHQVVRRRELEDLRQQIARDLHDDIGSNLGGIVLLSEIGREHCRDDDSREDFQTIHRAAEDASISLRDIVWLIQREPVGLKDFVTRMRQSLRAILNHPDIYLDVEPAVFQDRSLSLLFRRHVFLAFKEVLNNVRKHAQNRHATVKVKIGPDRLRFIVRDEGVGFDPKKTEGSGHGLDNLKRRASRVSGSVHIDSAPGQGTEVTFEAPFS